MFRVANHSCDIKTICTVNFIWSDQFLLYLSLYQSLNYLFLIFSGDQLIKIVIEYFSNISYSISIFFKHWKSTKSAILSTQICIVSFYTFPSIFIKAIFTSIFWLPLVSSKKHIYPSFTFYSQQHNYKSYFITKWQEFENILIFIS